MRNIHIKPSSPVLFATTRTTRTTPSVLLLVVVVLLLPNEIAAKLLALYRFEEPANPKDPSFYSVKDETGNSEGFLFGGSGDDPYPAHVSGPFTNPSSMGWDFGAGPYAVQIQPSEVLYNFGNDPNGGEYATGSATIAFAMKKSGSESFNRLITGPGVEIYELHDYISINIGGMSLTQSNSKIYDGQWHTHVITIKFGLNGELKHYLDAELIGTKQGNVQHKANLAKTVFWVLGRRGSNTGGNGWNGAMDDFCIFNHALPNLASVQTYDNQGGHRFLDDVLYPKERTYYMDPGVHPRVLFTPNDLPTLRQNVQSSSISAIVRTSFEGQMADNGFDNPTSTYGQLYQKLLNCDGEDFSSYDSLSKLGYVANDFDMERNFVWGSAFALMDDDTTRLTNLGQALACWADLVYELYSPDVYNFLTHDNFFDTALAYDLTAAQMTSTDQAKVRKLIAKATRNRVTYGSNFNYYDIGTNWHAFHDLLSMASLAIEGEDGYDPMVYELTLEKQRIFYKGGGVFESGFTHEGWQYYEFGQEGGVPALLSSVVRGEDLLETTWAKNAMTAALYQLSPFTEGANVNLYSYSDGAGPVWPGRTNIYGLMLRHMLPDDPLIEFFYRILTEHRRQAGPGKGHFFWYLFSVEPKAGNSFQSVADEMDLNLSLFCPDSGHAIFRSDWSEDAMSVQFHARMDVWGLGHVHADINHFALFANGFSWISDTGYHTTNNDHHSTVLIDGIGQAGSTLKESWPTLPGKFIDYHDDYGTFAHAIGDASFSYNYYREDRPCMLSGGSSTSCNNVERCAWNSITQECGPNWALEEKHWQFNMGVDFANYSQFTYPVNFDGSPRDPNSLAEIWKKDFAVTARGGMYNPVKFAFRTLIVVRGDSPYVLILDDIQADDGAEHEYIQSFQLRQGEGYDAFIPGYEPERTKKLSDTEPPTSIDAVLQIDNYVEGDPELVVRVIQADSVNPNNDPVIELVHLQEGSREDNSYALQVKRQSILPRFKTILYPRKNSSSHELVTSYDENTGVLRVEIGDQIDEFTFDSSNDDGRTQYTAQRRIDSTQFPSASPSSHAPSTAPTTLPSPTPPSPTPPSPPSHFINAATVELNTENANPQINLNHVVGSAAESLDASLYQYDCSIPVASDDPVTIVASSVNLANDVAEYTIEFDRSTVLGSSLIVGQNELNLCVVATLGSSSASDIYRASKISLTFDLEQASFFLEVNGATPDTFDLGEVSLYYVNACVCSTSFTCDESTSFMQENDLVSVCLWPSSPGFLFKDFSMSISGKTNGFTYSPITFSNGVQTPDSSTTLQQQADIWKVTTQLNSGLFDIDEGGSSQAVIEGTGLLEYVGAKSGGSMEDERDFTIVIGLKLEDEEEPGDCLFSFIREKMEGMKVISSFRVGNLHGNLRFFNN